MCEYCWRDVPGSPYYDERNDFEPYEEEGNEMLIQLNDQWRLRGIPKNLVLEKRNVVEKGEKAGEEYWTVEGYYSSFEQAITAVLKRHVETIEVEGIQNIISEIKMAVQAITKQITILNGGDESEAE